MHNIFKDLASHLSNQFNLLVSKYISNKGSFKIQNDWILTSYLGCLSDHSANFNYKCVNLKFIYEGTFFVLSLD